MLFEDCYANYISYNEGNKFIYIFFFSLFNRALLDMNEFSLNDNMERFIIKNKNYDN
jgi:hypothetical protein